MKKIVCGILVVMAVMLTVSVSHAEGKNIYIVHEDMPKWVEQTIGSNPTHYWFTSTHAYGVGVVKPMKNRSLQRTTAENRARAVLLKGLGVTRGNFVEIRGVWEDPDTRALYALARVKIDIIPAK